MFVDAFVNLYTRDIEAGLRFYRDLLGFRETFRTPKTGIPTHVELQLTGFGLGLGTVEAAKRVHRVDTSPERLRSSPVPVSLWSSLRTTRAATGRPCCATLTETWSRSWPSDLVRCKGVACDPFGRL